MNTMFTSLLAVVAAASYVAAQQFTVNTPNNPLECVPTQITWSGGSPPYTLLIQEPDANGTPVQVYSGISSTSFSWSTNITAGTGIGLTVRDNTGASAQSASVTIGQGTSDSCLTSGGSSGSTSAASTDSSTSSAAAGTSSSATAPTSGSTSAASSPAGTSSGASTGGSSTSAASHSSSGTASSASTSASATGGASSGSMANTVAMGAVGFVGALAAAVLA